MNTNRRGREFEEFKESEEDLGTWRRCASVTAFRVFWSMASTVNKQAQDTSDATLQVVRPAAPEPGALQAELPSNSSNSQTLQRGSVDRRCVF
jgi:hypothetical protein